MMSGTLGWSTILISSLTAYYDNDPALNYLLQEWDNHSIPIAVEVSNLRKRFGGTPTPKGPATVLKTPADLCYGSSTQDWFWCTLDPVVFQPPNETSRQSAREDTTSDAEDERVLLECREHRGADRDARPIDQGPTPRNDQIAL